MNKSLQKYTTNPEHLWQLRLHLDLPVPRKFASEANVHGSQRSIPYISYLISMPMDAWFVIYVIEIEYIVFVITESY